MTGDFIAQDSFVGGPAFVDAHTVRWTRDAKGGKGDDIPIHGVVTHGSVVDVEYRIKYVASISYSVGMVVYSVIETGS